MPLFSDREGSRKLVEQYGVDEYGIRQGTPVHVDRDGDARPLDLSEDDSIDGIALRKEQHPMKRGVLTDVVLETDGDSRKLVDFDTTKGVSRNRKVGVYDPELMIPIMRVADGDRIHLRSVSEDCEVYEDDDAPTFETDTPVSIVEDETTVEGVRIAPTATIDGRRNAIDIGRVAKFGPHKSSDQGYTTLTPIVVDKTR